jgi:tetratricopeptide (TPR) repeat protein
MMQSELARAIATEIEVHVTPQEQQHLSRASAVNPEAYNAYLLGDYMVKRESRPAIEEAIEHFQEAIRIDPNYAKAYAGLADAYFEREIWGGAGIGTSIDQIRAATLKALQLDEELPEGHALLARIHFQYDWDWQNTETEYKRAIELDPNRAETYQPYAFYLQAMSRHQEAIAAAHRAVELDPLSASAYSDEGRMFYRARQYQNAVASYQRALQLDPGFVPALSRIVEAYEQEQKFNEALAALRRFQQSTGNPHAGLYSLARIYARTGRRREALQVLNQIEKTNPQWKNQHEVASVYAALGDHDQALAALDRGIKARSILAFTLVDPQLDPLRSDPRFNELLHRVGLR